MNLRRRQELFFDGVETSLAMAQKCYFRLRANVEQYSTIAASGGNTDFQNSIMMDAWSFVDIINRLRILVSQSPGLKKNDLVKSFLKKSEQVVPLRHFVQHLNSEIPKIENTGMPIWGSLSWIYVSPEEHLKKQVTVITIIPGRLAKSKGHPIVNPAGKNIQLPIDHICLSASETTVNISEISRFVMQFENQYITALAQAEEIQVNSGESIAIVTLVRTIL